MVALMAVSYGKGWCPDATPIPWLASGRVLCPCSVRPVLALVAGMARDGGDERMIFQVLQSPRPTISDGTAKIQSAGKKCQEPFFLNKKCLVLGYVLSHIYNLLNWMEPDRTAPIQPQNSCSIGSGREGGLLNDC